MDDTADDSDADGSGEASAEEGDIAEGTIPVQGNAMEDVDPEPSTPIDTHAQSSTPINSQPPQQPSTSPSAAINKETRKTQLPKAIVTAKSLKIPVKIADKSEDVIQKSSPTYPHIIMVPITKLTRKHHFKIQSNNHKCKIRSKPIEQWYHSLVRGTAYTIQRSLRSSGD
jgi:hypothetical protein